MLFDWREKKKKHIKSKSPLGGKRKHSEFILKAELVRWLLWLNPPRIWLLLVLFAYIIFDTVMLQCSKCFYQWGLTGKQPEFSFLCTVLSWAGEIE